MPLDSIETLSSLLCLFIPVRPSGAVFVCIKVILQHFQNTRSYEVFATAKQNGPFDLYFLCKPCMVPWPYIPLSVFLHLQHCSGFKIWGWVLTLCVPPHADWPLLIMSLSEQGQWLQCKVKAKFNKTTESKWMNNSGKYMFFFVFLRSRLFECSGPLPHDNPVCYLDQSGIRGSSYVSSSMYLSRVRAFLWSSSRNWAR